MTAHTNKVANSMTQNSTENRKVLENLKAIIQTLMFELIFLLVFTTLGDSNKKDLISVRNNSISKIFLSLLYVS